MPTLTLIPCKPTGKTTGIGRGPDGCRPATMPTYARTAEGQRLRDARIAKRLTLCVFRTAFGLSPLDASGLEHGRLTLSSDEWKRLFAWLDKAELCTACDGMGRISGTKCKACRDGAWWVGMVLEAQAEAGDDNAA